MELFVCICRQRPLLDSLALAVHNNAATVVGLAEIEIFVNSLDVVVRRRSYQPPVRAHQSIPSAFGFVSHTGGHGHTLRGIPIAVVFVGAFEAVLVDRVEDLVSLVHHLFHIPYLVGGNQSSLQVILALCVVVESSNDGGVVDVERCWSQGKYCVHTKGEDGLLVVRHQNPKGVSLDNVVVDWWQYPIATAVNETHMFAGAIVDGTMSFVEDIAVVLVVVDKSTVDDHRALGVDELDVPVGKHCSKTLREDPSVMIGGFHHHVAVT